MGYQFYREETFARVQALGAPTTRQGRPSRTKRAPGRISAGDVIAEMCRWPGACPHVPVPQRPRVLHGIETDGMQAWFAQLLAKAAEQTAPYLGALRRQRSDTPIILGVVASYPGPADDHDVDYCRWRELTVAFLRERYGERLVTVMEHVDEAHGHVHAIVENAGASVKPLHAGHAAAMRLEGPKPRSEAYKAASRALQDDYYIQVAEQVGLARIGPGRRRLTRLEWRSEQVATRISTAKAEALADYERTLQLEREQLDRDKALLRKVVERLGELVPVETRREAEVLLLSPAPWPR